MLLRYVDYVAVAVLLILETNCVVELSMHISYTIIIFSLNLCLLHTETHSQRVTALTVRFGSQNFSMTLSLSMSSNSRIPVTYAPSKNVSVVNPISRNSLSFL